MKGNYEHMMSEEIVLVKKIEFAGNLNACENYMLSSFTLL